MLIRSARRKLQQDAYRTLQPSFEQIHLPWLCPAFYGRNPGVRTTTSAIKNNSASATRSFRSKVPSISSAKLRVKARGLASAAGTIYDVPQDLYIPWDGVSESYSPPISRPTWSSGPGISDLPNWDTSKPILVKEALSSPPRTFRGYNGVTGELDDVKETLHACLQVGRLERAAAMMRRLNVIYKADAPDLIQEHNHYIRELNSKIVRTQDAELLKHVYKWFEVDIRMEGIAPNAITYALMIQASLQEAIPSKLERTVRRYIHMAEEDGMRDEAMGVCLTLLHSQDVGKITQIAPTFPFEIDLSEVADMEQEIAVEEKAEPANLDLVQDLRTTETKGSSMHALRKTLSIFSDMPFNPNVDGMDGTPEERRWAFAMQRQLQLEKDTVASAIDRWRNGMESLKKNGIDGAMAQGSISALMWEWHEALVPKIKEEIRLANEAENHPSLRSHEENERCIYGPFLQYISAENLSAVTILTVLTSISTKARRAPPKLGNIVVDVGEAIREEILAESIKHGSPKVWRGLPQADRQGKLQSLIRRRLPRDSFAKLIGTTATTNQQSNIGDIGEWSPLIKARVGVALCTHLFAVAKIGVTHWEASPDDPKDDVRVIEAQPVFLRTCRFENGKRLGVVKLCDAMHDMLNRAPVDGLISKHLPMVAEPAPWTGYSEGGFYTYKVPVVRIGGKDPQLRRYAKIAADNGDMKQAFAGLDILGRTPWNINRNVFNIMVEAWNTGEAIANLSPENPQFNFPPEPSPDGDRKVHIRWAREVKELNNHKAGLHGQRSFQNLQLEVARAYLNETFYFPHNLDFRGRAYPIPPFLNHMGADNCRGLLRFGKGRELGSVGLTWLKVHLANVFGYDKASFEERKAFAEDHISDVCDSVNKPLNGNRWWLEAEDPWQCLATCFELKAALDAPDPEKFVSYLPVHQDGTCNGLQHYAALGGDISGAKQVNLEPGDRPSDIYTAVAEMVKKEVADEAAEGNEAAQILNGKLTRKVVKQTVMTNVYGVTFTGAKAQVRNVLEVLIPDMPNTDEMNHDVTSRYVAKKIFRALSTIFNGAHDIQYWLGDCAARITGSLAPDQIAWLERQAAGEHDRTTYKLKPRRQSELHEAENTAFRTTVIWTSPLKMPVVQPYRASPIRTISTNLQKISINKISPSDPVSKRKQLQAFPPNFIHSLDATHMLLSALKCDELGLSFAAVHDSFWTHAADVDVMNRVIRDAFIRMHSEDIVGRLAAEFAARYKGHWYLASFSNNSPIARKIIAFRRRMPLKNRTSATSKKTRFVELLNEKKRLSLLASDDPKLRAEGEAMVTPGSIYLEAMNQDDLKSVAEVEEVGLGPTKTSKRVAKLQTNEQIEVGDVDNATAVEHVIGDQTVFPGAESISVDDMEDELDEEAALEAAKQEKKEIKKKYPAKCRVWLPMTFPPVPKKGDFDVSRLRDSQYFFS